MPTSTMSCRSIAVIVSALAVSACAGDTAIVLSIRAEPSSAATTARRLGVYVGVGAAVAPAADPDSVVEPRWWKQAPIELSADALVFPDGLGDQTYELALRPSADLPLEDELVFAVASLSGSVDLGVTGYAHAAAPVRFAEGEIRRIDVVLTDVDERDDGSVTDTGCAWWRADPTDPSPNPVRDRAIVPADDADCDDYPSGPAPDCEPGIRIDCDDADPATHPGAPQDCSERDTDCCSTSIADTRDQDGDGVAICAGDCVDSGGKTDLFGELIPAVAINPNVEDTTCNGVDESCAIPRGGTCDPVGADPDGDHYVNCRDVNGGIVGAVDVTTCRQLPGKKDCLEQGTVTGFNNEGATVNVPAHEVHPGADDRACDGIDQDCSRRCDDGDPDLTDVDEDGFHRCARDGLVNAGGLTCDPGETAVDCNDGDPFGVPEPEDEQCDGFDSGCNGFDQSNSMQPCLPVTTTAAACQPGFLTCAESAGSEATVCRGIPSAPTLPLQACAPCTGGGSPLNCLDGRFSQCPVHTPTGAAGPACTDPVQDHALLPCPGAASGQTCTWEIVGGDAAAMVGGWSIGLVDRSGPTTGDSTLTGTEARVLVMTAGVLPRGFIVRRTDAFGASLEVVVLRRDPNPGCTAMSCGPGSISM